MASRFRTLRKSLAPRWLTEGEGELVGYALDIVKDAFVERCRLGLLARLPQNDPTGTLTAPSDALAAIGRDRRVVRGIAETDESYARRLLAWLDDRKIAGNPFALMKKLAEYTGPLCSFRTVDNSGNWFSRAADGTQSIDLKKANWDWDSTPAKWSRFWVIIYPNGLWDQGRLYDDGLFYGVAGETYTWGTSATVDEVVTVQGLIADWKPAGTRCVNVIIAFDPASFDPTAAVDSTGMPDGLWGHWSKTVAGVKVPSRLSTARYWDGA